MRLIILLVSLFMFLAQAQENTTQEPKEASGLCEPNENGETDPICFQIAFVVRLGNPDNARENVEKFISNLQSQENFKLVPITPNDDLPRSLLAVFPNALALPALFQLDGRDSSLCNGLALGLVSGSEVVNTQVLENFEKLLIAAQNGTDIGFFGLDGESAHSGDMTPPEDQDAEKVFADAARVSNARDLAYTNVETSNNIIAILDSGVSTDVSSDPEVFDLQSAIMQNFQIDLLEFDQAPQDEYEDYMNIDPSQHFNKGHGTPIALLAHNVANKANILPIRACEGDYGTCLSSKVILGICYAVNVAEIEEKNLILNMSFSALGENINFQQSSLFRTLWTVTLLGDVFAATEVGNKGGEAEDYKKRYPAGLTDEGFDSVISVSGLKLENGAFLHADKSTRGNYIDVAALGNNQFVNQHIVGFDLDNNPYMGGYSGTSFATPWLAGTLSLMLEVNSQRQAPLPPKELKDCIKSTTQAPKPPDHLLVEVGYGMIDIEAAVRCVKEYPTPQP